MRVAAVTAVLFLSTSFGGLGCSLKSSESKTKYAAAPKNTNIILLMGDDHGWEETGYNGHPFVQTPSLDNMARNGLVFNRFYSAHPTCSPTRGSIITGRHPHRYGTFVPNRSIRPEEISIAQLLKEAGYVTAHFGKWHLGPVKAESPTNPGAMGFDTWVSHDNFFEMDPVLSRNGADPVAIEGEGSEVIVDAALSFIKSAIQEDRPFFTVVWFGSPHEPYQAQNEDLALYGNLPDSLSREFTTLTSLKTGLQVNRPMDSVLPARFAEITAMDRAIGKLRDYLKKEAIRDNTLVWYCGDNGIPSSGVFNSSLRGLKGKVYEGGTRVPGIIEWPEKIDTPMTSEVNAVTTDIFSTIVELAQLQLPDRPLDGLSLMPVIRGEIKQRSTPICFWNFDTGHLQDNDPYIDPELQKGTTPLTKVMDGAYTRTFENYHHKEIMKEDYRGERAILGNRYKLVIHPQENGELKELFDIRKDPGETKNILDGHPDIATDLENHMKTWQESVLRSLTEKDYEDDGK